MRCEEKKKNCQNQIFSILQLPPSQSSLYRLVHNAKMIIKKFFVSVINKIYCRLHFATVHKAIHVSFIGILYVAHIRLQLQAMKLHKMEKNQTEKEIKISQFKCPITFTVKKI